MKKQLKQKDGEPKTGNPKNEILTNSRIFSIIIVLLDMQTSFVIPATGNGGSLEIDGVTDITNDGN